MLLCTRVLRPITSQSVPCDAGAASRACYVNSGTFMASSRALLEWLPAVTAMAKDAVGVEANDDQAAIHRHFLRTAATASAARSATSIDRLSSTFLTLYPCKADSRPLARYSRADGRTECHNEGRGGYAPLDYAAVGSDGGLTMHDYAVRAAPSTRLAGRKTDASQATRRPLIAHANGMHFLLETMLRIWDNQLDEDATNSTARSSRWRGPTLGSRLWPPKPSLLEHPILLVDPAGSTTFQRRRDSPPPGAESAAGPARGCTMRVTTLGDIFAPRRAPDEPPVARTREEAAARGTGSVQCAMRSSTQTVTHCVTVVRYQNDKVL